MTSTENHPANVKIEDERLIAKTITPTQNFSCSSSHLPVIQSSSVSSCHYDNFSEIKKERFYSGDNFHHNWSGIPHNVYSHVISNRTTPCRHGLMLCHVCMKSGEYSPCSSVDSAP